MTPELAHWVIGMLGSCTVVVVGAVVWLTTLVFNIGKKYGALEAIADKIDKSGDRIDRIPILETKLDQLAQSHAEERRRFASDWPEMHERVTTLWERSRRRESQGEYGGE